MSGAPAWTWLLAAAVAAVALAAMHVVRRLAVQVSRRLAGRPSPAQGAVALVARTHPLFLLVLALAAGGSVLGPQAPVRSLLDRAVLAALFLQAAALASDLLTPAVERYLTRQGDGDGAAAATAHALSLVGRVAIWSLAALLALANLGVNVTALVAGLGVGSVAVALALQNVLGDLFASMAIVLDRPFAIGDFITVDAFAGTVEHIGLKSTRLRSLGGELIVLSNTDLLRSRIRNYKRMYERRVVFGFGVSYDTPRERLEAVPAMVREIVGSQAGVRFERAHLKSLGASSLEFEVVYHVTDPDYNRYMDVQQAINLELLRRFAEEGIRLAYPTQTVFVRGWPEPGGEPGTRQGPQESRAP